MCVCVCRMALQCIEWRTKLALITNSNNSSDYTWLYIQLYQLAAHKCSIITIEYHMNTEWFDWERMTAAISDWPNVLFAFPLIDVCVCWMGLCVNGMLSTAIILIWRCWQTTTLTNDGNNTRNKKQEKKNVKIVVCLFISVFLSCVVCFPFPSLHLCCIHTHTDRQTDRHFFFACIISHNIWDAITTNAMII